MVRWLGNSYEKKFQDDESALIQALKDHDDKAFEFLYQYYFPIVEKFIVSKGGNEEDAKDIFQESLIAIWRNIKKGQYESQGQFKSYLIQVCKFRWFDQLKGGNKKYMVYDGETRENVVDEQGGIINFDSESDEIDAMLHWYSQLGEKCREILKLFYFENQNLKTIGKTLEMQPSSAKNAKYRCVEKLKSIIKSSNYEHSESQ